MFPLLLSMALLLAPQVNPANPQNPVPPQQKCTVSGIVLSEATGQPLRDASVTLREAGVRRTLLPTVTGPDGRFEIKNVDPDRYYVNASKAGYVSMEYGQKAPDDPAGMLALAPGQTVRNVSFQMIRAAVITGYVYNEDGEPIEHAQVFALHYRYFQGGRRLMAGGFAMTDDRGKYRLFDLAPGGYYISASANPMGNGGAFTYGPAYYPGVPDPSQASSLTVHAGNEFPDVDLTLPRISIYDLRGRVVSSLGNAPIVDANLQIVTRTEALQSFGMGGRIKNAEGDFDFPGVRPGSYFLVARLSENGHLYQARQQVTVTDSDVDGIRLVLTPGATLRGVIQTEGSVDLSKLRIDLRPPRGMTFGSYGTAAISPDGTLEFDSVPDDHYRVGLYDLPQNAYVKSVMLGDQEVLDSGFDIANGQAPGTELKIVVSANGAQIGGSVMLDG